MATHTPGNRSGKFNVHQLDMGGWVRVFIDPMATVPDDVAVYLSHALTGWFRRAWFPSCGTARRLNYTPGTT